MGIIYCLTSPSGKKYIGKTMYSLSQRWNGHKYNYRSKRKNCVPLYLAFDKYGPESFIKEILADQINDEDLLSLIEIDFIEKFKLDGHELYNVTDGGDGLSLGFKHTKESRHKMSVSALKRERIKRKTGFDNSIHSRRWKDVDFMNEMKLKFIKSWDNDERKRNASNRSAKLTEDQVIEILELLKTEKDYKTISLKYPVKERAIKDISDGKTWKHIERN